MVWTTGRVSSLSVGGTQVFQSGAIGLQTVRALASRPDGGSQAFQEESVVLHAIRAPAPRPDGGSQAARDGPHTAATRPDGTIDPFRDDSRGQQIVPATASRGGSIEQQQNARTGSPVATDAQVQRRTTSNASQSRNHLKISIKTEFTIAPKGEGHCTPSVESFVETLAENHNRQIPFGCPRMQTNLCTWIGGGSRDEWYLQLNATDGSIAPPTVLSPGRPIPSSFPKVKAD